MLKTFCAAEFTCHADEVENNISILREHGYCWELNRYPDEKNEYREYVFRVFIKINLITGRVEPQ